MQKLRLRWSTLTTLTFVLGLFLCFVLCFVYLLGCFAFSSVTRWLPETLDLCVLEEIENRFTSTGCAQGAEINRQDPCMQH